jgi:transposase
VFAVTERRSTTLASATVRVAIDVAKLAHQVLIETPSGQRRSLRVANTRAGIDALIATLDAEEHPCDVAFEPTGDYHRPLAYWLGAAGFQLYLVSSIAVARTREARYNSWDKNDPKDAQVILHLLKTRCIQRFVEPGVGVALDLQEVANTYQQLSRRKVRLHHALVTHHLPVFFPEAERYLHSSRATWGIALLRFTPCPAAVRRYSCAEFVEAASAHVRGQKADRRRWLADFYAAAVASVGIPVAEDSEAMRMFRLLLDEYQLACERRAQLEADVVVRLQTHPDFLRLQTLPGVGPILALMILAEAGDLRRFAHVRQFLKYCGFDLCTEQSGNFRGQTHLSKRGNARLRCAFWMAATIAVRMRQNSFRRKYEDYLRSDPQNADRRRKAYTACAAKMARVAYTVVKTGIDYRRFPEAAIPGGRIPSPRAVEAPVTS